MGARSIASRIEGFRCVSNVKWEYDSKLQFDYERPMEYPPKTILVYLPSRDDYEITIEVVDRAIEFGANVIVYDIWIKPTISGNSHAVKNGINVYSFGAFLKKVMKGEKL